MLTILWTFEYFEKHDAENSDKEEMFQVPCTEQFLIFVPVTTLRQAAREATRDGLTSDRIHARNFMWDEWGPAGTRVVQVYPSRIDSTFSLGSRAIHKVLNLDGLGNTLDVFTFDVHPYVSHRQRRSAALDELVDTREELTNAKSFSVAIRTTFPVHVTHSVMFPYL